MLRSPGLPASVRPVSAPRCACRDAPPTPATGVQSPLAPPQGFPSTAQSRGSDGWACRPRWYVGRPMLRRVGGGRGRGCVAVRDSKGFGFDNWELLVGDCVSLLSFCLYKQVSALVLLPTFPGWTAPLHLNPLRLEEFLSFSLTVIGTWVASSLLLRNYETASTANVPTSLTRTTLAWLLSMPTAAAQLVLVTAAESQSLIGTEGFADVLPLAASGPGEPFVTALGVLCTMTVWRSFYTIFLDYGNFRTMEGPRMDREKAAIYFQQAVSVMVVLGLLGTVGMQVVGLVLENGGEAFI